jgi:hypothetical protein
MISTTYSTPLAPARMLDQLVELDLLDATMRET